MIYLREIPTNLFKNQLCHSRRLQDCGVWARYTYSIQRPNSKSRLVDKVDSGIGLPSAHGTCVGVDSGVYIRWVYSQLRHRVSFTMFLFGFGLRSQVPLCPIPPATFCCIVCRWVSLHGKKVSYFPIPSREGKMANLFLQCSPLRTAQCPCPALIPFFFGSLDYLLF
jgi:hypothetical protein